MQTEMTPTMDTARHKHIEISKFRQIFYNLPSMILLSNEHFTSNTTCFSFNRPTTSNPSNFLFNTKPNLPCSIIGIKTFFSHLNKTPQIIVSCREESIKTILPQLFNQFLKLAKILLQPSWVQFWKQQTEIPNLMIFLTAILIQHPQ